MPAEVVVDVVVVPVVLPQLRVLGVLGGRVPVVLGELLELVVLLVDLVVGLALLGWFIFLRGGAWVGIGAASTSRRASVRALFSFRAAFVPLVSSRPSWPRPRPWACRSSLYSLLSTACFGHQLAFWRQRARSQSRVGLSASVAKLMICRRSDCVRQ